MYAGPCTNLSPLPPCPQTRDSLLADLQREALQTLGQRCKSRDYPQVCSLLLLLVGQAAESQQQYDSVGCVATECVRVVSHGNEA